MTEQITEAKTEYKITADIETASDDYATRFAGAVGAWMLRVQSDMVRKALADVPHGAPVLEVGGGHGQLAGSLVQAGFRLTVTGSDATCRRRIADLVDAGACSFQVADALRLPFDDGAFEAVVCVRLIMHSGEHWPALAGELCRVARSLVVLDYPTSQSVNCLANTLFKAKRKLEGNTRTFRLFRHAELRAAFAAHGFDCAQRAGQFFWPMVLHRMLRRRGLAAALEWLPRRLGLTWRWGSPVIAGMRRRPVLYRQADPPCAIPPGTPVLVTGATGFTGQVLTRKLAQAGLQVRAIARASSNMAPLSDLPVQWFRGDVFDPAVVQAAMPGVEYVFHVAASYREARHQDDMYTRVHVTSTQLLARAALAQSGFKRFVHVSTAGVHGHIEKPPADEQTPMRPGDVYQRTKAEGESWLHAFAAQNHLPYTVIRPAAIYGPGDTRLLKFFRMAARPWMIMLGYGAGLYHLIHVDDLTNVIILAATHPAAAGEAFICGNAECASMASMARTIAAALGRRVRIVRLPAGPFFLLAAVCEHLCRRLGIEPPLHRRRVAFFTKDRAFDTSKLQKRLGYTPRYTNTTGLEETARWYKNRGWLK